MLALNIKLLRQAALTLCLIFVASMAYGDSEKEVVSEEKIFELNFGLSGSWFNPLHPGQGFFFDVNPELFLVWISWFTYGQAAPEDESIIGYPDNRWFVALGNYTAGMTEVTLTILETDGGIFDDAAPVTETGVGSITLEFISCSEAILDFSFTETGLQGQIPLERLTSTEVCEAYTAPLISPASDNR